jgi:exodeoxyribonuclease VII large subunit
LLDPKTEKLARQGQALQSAMRFTKQRQHTNLARQGETLTRFGKTAEAALKRQLDTQSRRLDRADKLLDAYSYKGTLERGFALVRDEAGQVIRSKSAAKSGQAVSLTFADGDVGAMIAGGAPKAPRKSAKRAVQKEADKKQADLF